MPDGAGAEVNWPARRPGRSQALCASSREPCRRVNRLKFLASDLRLRRVARQDERDSPASARRDTRQAGRPVPCLPWTPIMHIMLSRSCGPSSARSCCGHVCPVCPRLSCLDAAVPSRARGLANMAGHGRRPSALQFGYAASGSHRGHPRRCPVSWKTMSGLAPRPEAGLHSKNVRRFPGSGRHSGAAVPPAGSGRPPACGGRGEGVIATWSASRAAGATTTGEGNLAQPANRASWPSVNCPHARDGPFRRESAGADGVAPPRP